MKYLAADIETIGLRPYNGIVWMISLTEGTKSKLIEDCEGLEKLPAEVVKKLEDPTVCKIFHNALFDVPYLQVKYGIKVRNIWCSYNMEIVIQGTRVKSKTKNIEEGSAADRVMSAHSPRLEYVLPRYGFPKPDKSIRDRFANRAIGVPFTKVEKTYAIDDTKHLPQIQKAQEYLLKRDELWNVALLENKVTERLADMRTHGIGINPNTWREVAIGYEAEFKKRMAKLPKEVSNWNSEKQVKKYFADKGILIPSYTELYSVYLQTKNKVLGDFIYARELHKAVTSYGLNWFEDGFIDPDNRVRPSIDQIIDTGRNSFSEPNLQQLPGEGNQNYERGIVMKILRERAGEVKNKWLHRTAFVPRKGCKFVIGDFTGQELGIMASMANEKLWVDAMLRGEDVHSLVASLISPAAWSAAAEKGCSFPKKCNCKGHKELRNPAKINNFMLAYGGGAERLAANTGMERRDAIMYCAAHKRLIPNLTKALERNGREALETGVTYSADPYRRRRVLRSEEDWQIRNQGKNTPIQSAGANMLKLAMVSVPEEYYIALVIHDEIILEVPTKEAAKAAKVLKAVMEKSADYVTGIKGLIKVTPRIAENIMKD